MPYRNGAIAAAEAALDALDNPRNAAPPIEHSDAREIDDAYERIRAREPQSHYDEAAEAAATVDRYLSITAKPRATWGAADAEFVELAAELPEIKALGRRALARIA